MRHPYWDMPEPTPSWRGYMAGALSPLGILRAMAEMYRQSDREGRSNLRRSLLRRPLLQAPTTESGAKLETHCARTT